MSNNGEMISDSVTRAYASALVELAEADGQLSEVADELEQLGQLLASEPALKSLLASRALSASERAGALERLFKGQLSDLVYRFIQVVNQKDRIGKLAGIIDTFGEIVAESRGIVEVDVHVATKLDDAQAQRVAQGIGQSLGKEVALHQYVDEKLIGGLKIRIGDKLVDASVATQLKLMQRKLVAAGREKARQAVAASE